jgi:hypothetical protein
MSIRRSGSSGQRGRPRVREGGRRGLAAGIALFGVFDEPIHGVALDVLVALFVLLEGVVLALEHDIFDVEGRFIGRVPLKPSGLEILEESERS